MAPKTSTMQDALVAIAHASVVTPITNAEREAIEIRGD